MSDNKNIDNNVEVISEDLVNPETNDENLSEVEITDEVELVEDDQVYEDDIEDEVTLDTPEGLDNKENEGDLINEENYPQIDFDRIDQLSDEEAIAELDKIIAANDVVSERDFLSSLIEQDGGESVVYYEVENIYRNDIAKAYKSRLRMRQDPPVLVIKDNLGNEASFILTENLTEELIGTFEEVKRAYYGFSKPRALDYPNDFLGRVQYVFKKKPFKVIVPAVIATLFLILLIKGMVQ